MVGLHQASSSHIDTVNYREITPSTGFAPSSLTCSSCCAAVIAVDRNISSFSRIPIILFRASIAQLESARMRVRFAFFSPLCFSVLFLLTVAVGSSSGSRRSGNTCIRQPEGVERSKTPGDNGYRLKISGNPQKYFPGEVYTGKKKKLRPTPDQHIFFA